APGAHVACVPSEERARGRAAGIGVVRVRAEIDRAAVGVAADGADLVDEWITRPASSAQTALLDALEELVDRKIARSGHRVARLGLEEARRGASGQRRARGRDGPRPRANGRAPEGVRLWARPRRHPGPR